MRGENGRPLWVPQSCLKTAHLPSFLPNFNLTVSVNSGGWWRCIFSQPGTINPLIIGTGGSSDDPRGHFSTNDADPDVTLNIVKTFPTGWKTLSQELVDEILTYLKDDFLSLVSCSESCKALFCSTRPLVHHTFCLSTGTLADRSRSSPRNKAQFDNLRLAERAQVLQYTTRLIIRLGRDFNRGNLRPHLQYFRAMQGITSLEIGLLDATSFLPAFGECFGHIVPTLRFISLIDGVAPIDEIIRFIPRFPLLQDLGLSGIVFPRRKPHQPRVLSGIRTPPPLDGTLRFRTTNLAVFARSLVDITGGIHFRLVEMKTPVMRHYA